MLLIWWRGMDLNHGPSGYEPDELPDCSTPRRLIQYSDKLRDRGDLSKSLLKEGRSRAKD